MHDSSNHYTELCIVDTGRVKVVRCTKPRDVVGCVKHTSILPYLQIRYPTLLPRPVSR